DSEFLQVLELPREVPEAQLAVAMSQTMGAKFPEEAIRSAGWTILDPQACAPDWPSYRDFLQASRGEFSVANQTYVKARPGWFSCRSACYLAAGRPVVTQETGWSRYVPAGEGLLTFRDREGALDALHRLLAEPDFHARRAREVAEEHFDS